MCKWAQFPEELWTHMLPSGTEPQALPVHVGSGKKLDHCQEQLYDQIVGTQTFLFMFVALFLQLRNAALHSLCQSLHCPRKPTETSTPPCPSQPVIHPYFQDSLATEQPVIPELIFCIPKSVTTLIIHLLPSPRCMPYCPCKFSPQVYVVLLLQVLQGQEKHSSESALCLITPGFRKNSSYICPKFLLMKLNATPISPPSPEIKNS